MEILYSEDSIDLFRNPARVIIAGYGNSGKTEMCSRMIEKHHDRFNTISYCSVNSQPLQNNQTISKKLFVSNKIVNLFEYMYNGNTLFILDDCFLDAIESKFVVNAFIKGQHENISTISIIQNLFLAGISHVI